jgi:hypothetical protein
MGELKKLGRYELRRVLGKGAMGMIVFMLLAAAHEGHAADSEGRSAVYGERACWDYIVWFDTGNLAELDKLTHWIRGYVTAYNRQTPDTFSVLGGGNPGAAMAWLARWCRANPTAKVSQAMSAFVEDHHPRRYRTIKDANK